MKTISVEQGLTACIHRMKTRRRRVNVYRGNVLYAYTASSKQIERIHTIYRQREHAHTNTEQGLPADTLRMKQQTVEQYIDAGRNPHIIKQSHAQRNGQNRRKEITRNTAYHLKEGVSANHYVSILLSPFALRTYS